MIDFTVKMKLTTNDDNLDCRDLSKIFLKGVALTLSKHKLKIWKADFSMGVPKKKKKL